MEDDGFLREVQIGSTPYAILATKRQLENIVIYCCQPDHFSVFGIDATFELGDFYVTLTTYRNPSLRNCRTNSEPIFLGQLSSTWSIGLKIIKHSFPASSSTSPASMI